MMLFGNATAKEDSMEMSTFAGYRTKRAMLSKGYCLSKQGIVVTHLAYIDDDMSDLKDSLERNILGIEKPCAES